MLSNGGVAWRVVSPAQSIGRSVAVVSSPPLCCFSSRAPSPVSSSFPARSLSKLSSARRRTDSHLALPQESPQSLSPTLHAPPSYILNERGVRPSRWQHRRSSNRGNFVFRSRDFELRIWTSGKFTCGCSHHLLLTSVHQFPILVVGFSSTQQRRWREFGSIARRGRIAVTAVVASVDDSRTKLNQKPLYDELQRYGLDESDYDSTAFTVRRQESNLSVTTNSEVGKRGMPKKRKASSELTASGKEQEKPTLKDESGVVEDWCAYLLVSGDLKKTYVGVTYDIRRRLRQHNGEIAGGAKSARAGRPWRLVCTVRGFENRSEVCQFEWTWKSTTAKVKVVSKPDSDALESPLITRRRATLAKVIESKEEWSNLDVHWHDK